MRLLKNRIIISFLLIFSLAFFWEFGVKSATDPLYTEAVARYRDGKFERSLQLLQAAYETDPNNVATLSLMGWDYLKLGEAQKAEPYFRRAHTLSPAIVDNSLGYAYTEIALKNYDQAATLLKALIQKSVNTTDLHLASGLLYRAMGRNRESAREFQRVLALDKQNQIAVNNLREIYNVTGDVRSVSVDFQPFERPPELTYTARVEGENFAWLEQGEWKQTYLIGVDLTAALPGHFPADAATEPANYDDWLKKISALGANTIRVYAILPSAFYSSLFQFNQSSGRTPLRLLQAFAFGEAPRGDLFNSVYFANCQKEIRDTINVVHGQGDIGANPIHGGGIYNNNNASWVAGFLMGQALLPHVVTANNQLHPGLRTYHGTYIEVPSGNATEIFLAQMIDYAAGYEEQKYNWQRPIAFVNQPSLDPIRHPSESTTLEEVSLRRARGEHFPLPAGPYDDDDSVSIDPMHLRARARFPAGYFASYSVFPFYPDFISRDAKYRQIRDAEGTNTFLGYLYDLKAHHRGIPLVISDYGIPNSLGNGHFSLAGFDQGGKTEDQQGQSLCRLTRNVFEAGAAGGMVFEWVDEWFRRTWLVSKFEVPEDRKPLWTNFMDPAEDFGLLAAEPHLSSLHYLDGNLAEWGNKTPVYSESHGGLFRAEGDPYDSSRHLKALYADADEGFLYLRLVVGKFGNHNETQPAWKNVNYLIGISTDPGQAGLTHLPFIAPLRFPMGMTFAIQLGGPSSSRILMASSYNPYVMAPIEGAPTQNEMTLKLGWQPKIAEAGTFEGLVIEPNRRRFARNGEYSPPQRYDRGLLRYGSLNPQSPDYDSLAEWHVNVQTNTIDMRIPWNLLNVTDPSSYKIVSGVDRDGAVTTLETSGFVMTAFSYVPLPMSESRPIMEQLVPVADALPGLLNSSSMLATAYQSYRWRGWETPQYRMRTKSSYAMLRKVFVDLAGLTLPADKSLHLTARSRSRPRLLSKLLH